MKTFKQFITEEEPQDLEDFLLDNCRPLMSELDADVDDLKELALYRGIGHPSGRRVKLNVDGEIVWGYLQSVRKNRTPLDTHPDVSDILDDYLDHEFGWKPRKTTVFAYGKHGQSHARNFGTVYRIYPMGKFRYIWGEKIDDITADIGGLFDKYHIKKKDNGDSYDKEELAEIYELISDEFEGRYRNDNLWGAISDAPSEIMIECDQYLALRQ